MNPLRAYVFDTDEHQNVLFARSEAGARALAARQTGNSFEEQAVTYRPELDACATRTGGSPTPANFLAAGWWVECSCGCGHRVDSSGECYECMDDEGTNEPTGPVITESGEVFCSWKHHDIEMTERQTIRDRKAAARAELLDGWPFVEPTYAWRGGTAGCKCYNRDWLNVCWNFTFIGARLGRDTGSYCHGCKMLWVCAGDMDTFRALRDVRPDVIVEVPHADVP